MGYQCVVFSLLMLVASLSIGWEDLYCRYICAVLSHSVMSDSCNPVAWQSPLFMGILQARMLESVAIPCARGKSYSYRHLSFPDL